MVTARCIGNRSGYRAAITLSCLLFPLLAHAQKYDPGAREGKPVSDIIFDPAGQPFTSEQLLSLLPLKIHAPFHEAELRTAIQALFSTGRYRDISVDGSSSDGGLALRFITKPMYFVGHVEVNGVKEPPSAGQLVSATKLVLGAPFYSEDQATAVSLLTAVLRRNGYYGASVKPDIDYDAPNQLANIEFTVTTGNRARFTSPQILGNPGRDEESIIKSTRWKRLYGLWRWQPVTEQRVQQGLENIRRYYEKKDLLLARVNLRRLEYDPASNTVQPVIFIEAGPLVSIRVEGAGLSMGRLRELVPVFEERAVDEELIMEGQRNIAEYFQARGYFETAVSHTEENKANNERQITYVVNTGPVHKVVKLAISGNRYFPTSTIRERLDVIPATFPRYPHGRYSKALLDRDVQAITDLYESNGFEHPQITTGTVDDYQGRKGHIEVSIQIAEGVQTLVSGVTFEGLTTDDERLVRRLLRSSPGQPYSDVNVAADRDNVLNFFYNQGFLNASFDYEALPQRRQDRIALRFIVHQGEQHFVREVLVGGLEATKPGLVFSRMELQPNDPLSLAKETDTERRLYQLGIFARVDTAIQNPDGHETNKSVLFELDEARRYSISVGVGAEFGRIGGGYTLDAPAGAAGFSPQFTFGISRLNVFGRGHIISLQTGISNFEQRAGLNYLIPQFIGNPNLSLTFGALYDSSHDVRTFNAIRREVSAQLAQKLTKVYTAQYRLSFRRVTQSDLLIDPLLVPLLAQPVRIGMMGVTLIQDKRDDPADSHTGIYTTLDASYAPKFLASETQFTRLTFRNSTYHPFRRDLVFARSTFFGWNAPLRGDEPIPIAEHYFAGGATTHRGFPENQAGPRDLETGFPLGGNAVLMNNLELRFPVFGDNLGGVLFLDSGNVYSNIQHISFRFRQKDLQDFDYMVHSAGIGIRYKTPIGPIRVDLSLSPNPPRFVGYKGSLEDFLDPDKRDNLERVTQRINVFQFHFSLGQAF